MLMTPTKCCGRLRQSADKISGFSTSVFPLANIFISVWISICILFFFFFFWRLDLCPAHVHYRPPCNLQCNLRQGLHTLAKLSCVGCAGVSQQVPSVDSLSGGGEKRKDRNFLMAFMQDLDETQFSPISLTVLDGRK